MDVKTARDTDIMAKQVAAGIGGPALLVGADGTPYDQSNPLPVSGAPGGEATIADGADVCEGAVADAAVAAGAAGTVSAKLRRATTQLAALGAAADAAVIDPTASASMIALLKGILTQQNAILAILTDVYDDVGHTLKTS